MKFRSVLIRCVMQTVVAGGLTTVAVAAGAADDITLGSGNLTLNVVGAVAQVSGNGITAAGLQLLGSGSVHLDDSGNNVSTLAAGYSGPISYTDADALSDRTSGRVGKAPSTTTHGISYNNSDVKLTVLAGGLTQGEAAVTTDDITLGSGKLTLNVV